MRSFCVGLAPLYQCDGRDEFIDRAGEYYDVVEGMRGLWSQYAP